MSNDMGYISPRDFFNDFVQIGIIVQDLDQTVQVLSEVLGFGPFRFITWPPPDRTDMVKVYRGKPGEFSYRMAFAELGPIELEMIQPLDGESVWADFLAEHGQGIHHIRFNVLDMQAAIDHLAQHGIKVSQMGPGLRPGTA